MIVLQQAVRVDARHPQHAAQLVTRVIGADPSDHSHVRAEGCQVERGVGRTAALNAARLVLEHWGVTCTSDIGDIVFTLVDMGLLVSQPNDSRDDFYGVFDFAHAFEHEYPWSAANV